MNFAYFTVRISPDSGDQREVLFSNVISTIVVITIMMLDFSIMLMWIVQLPVLIVKG